MLKRTLSILLLAFLLPACTTLQDKWANAKNSLNDSGETYLGSIDPKGVQTDIPPEARLGQGYWDLPAGSTGAKHIVIDTKEQKVFYYSGGQLVGQSPMSSGKEGYGTPAGNYTVIQKQIDYKSGTYGVLKSRATGATIDGDYSTQSGRKIPAGSYYDPAPMPYWMRFKGGYGMHVGFVAGYPVSHGCVRLPADMAKTFYENTPLGTPVTVK